jgi:maltose/moltooligosaccharide transporter
VGQKTEMVWHLLEAAVRQAKNSYISGIIDKFSSQSIKMPTTATQVRKPRLHYWQIWNMSFGFLGIQFGFALQNANMSRIFQTLGANIDDIPILWLAAPLTGMIVQPIIGYMSDRTWNRLGRRKPFFLAGAILASLALLIIPNSPALWVAAGMLWMLDASINISMEPFRAMIADMLPEEQQTSGFCMQTFFIGIGAITASLLPALLTEFFKVKNTAPPHLIPDSVKWSFYLGAAAFLGAVVWTIAKTREYPPQQFQQYNPHPENTQNDGITGFFRDFATAPRIIWQLGAVQFFTWFGLFAMWIYMTPAVTQHLYHTIDTNSAAYNKGANWVGTCFAAYNGLATIAIFLPLLTKKIGNKLVHCLCLLFGGAGLFSVMFMPDPQWLLLSMAGIGIAWASILSTPYSMLAGSLPPQKMGIYMGIFNFFITLPQILAAIGVLKLLVNIFGNGQPIFALVLGGISMFIAAGLTLVVKGK